MKAADAYTGDPEIDRLLWSWGRVIAWASGWERGFCLSIQRDRKKAGWRPSHKQRAMMARLVERMQRDAPAEREDDELPEGGLIEAEA